MVVKVSFAEYGAVADRRANTSAPAARWRAELIAGICRYAASVVARLGHVFAGILADSASLPERLILALGHSHRSR
jgi:hypothetical protein